MRFFRGSIFTRGGHMIVRFMHHSAFLVEVDDKVFVFDFFNGDRVDGYRFEGELPEYEPNTKIYMFASHCHRDHYDLDILRLKQRYPNMQYVFSKDIRVSPHFLKKHGFDPAIRESILFVGPGEKHHLDDINIMTLRSTDAGVAFYVETNNATFFHAGDLNDWRWEGAGELVNNATRMNFRAQIKKLAKLPINVAFFPMDPRLAEHQTDGIDFFLKNTDCDYVFPMHMWQQYDGIAAYRKRISNQEMANKIVTISYENQEFEIKEN